MCLATWSVYAMNIACMNVDGQCIGAVIACSLSISSMPALHLIWIVSCFGFRSDFDADSYTTAFLVELQITGCMDKVID